MGKHSRFVNGIWDNDMRYPELNKNQSNVNADMMMDILPNMEL